MSSHKYPSSGSSPYWGAPVATSSSLPASGITGEIRLVLDTDDLYEWNGTAWERVTQNTADVQGPASATDNTLPRYDGITGKLIQGSGVTVSDTNDVTGIAAISATSATIGSLAGVVKATAGALSASAVGLSSSDVTGVLPVANGGTNSSAALSNNRVMRSSAGSVVEAAAITASRALVSDGSGIPTHSAVTTTELGYVSGVTSALQTQVDAKVAKGGDTMTGLLTLSADPSAALHAATKQYVDSVAAGLDVKPSVRLATTANITLSGEQTIDGVLTASSRVLVKNQTTTSANGIYVSASGAWTRATDMDAWAEVPGAFVFVEQGTLYADTGWVCTADLGGTLGSTAITWSQFAGAGTYTTDGQGIELTGTQLALELDGATLVKSATGLKVASVTATDLSYLTGLSSSVQTQLDAVRAIRGNVSVSSNVTLTSQRLHFVDTTAARTLTLPAPSATLYLVVKDVSGSAATNNITVNPAGAQTIDGASSFVIDANHMAVTIVSDGTNYFVI